MAKPHTKVSALQMNFTNGVRCENEKISFSIFFNPSVVDSKFRWNFVFCDFPKISGDERSRVKNVKRKIADAEVCFSIY